MPSARAVYFDWISFVFSLLKFVKSQILSFLFFKNSLSYKQNTVRRKIQRQEKHSDKIHQAVKCLHKTSHVDSKFRFKNAQVASTFSQSISMFFLDNRWRKKKRKKNEKTKKNPTQKRRNVFGLQQSLSVSSVAFRS